MHEWPSRHNPQEARQDHEGAIDPRIDLLNNLVAQGHSTQEAAEILYNAERPTPSPDGEADERRLGKTLDDETKQELRRIISDISGIGFYGKTPIGTAIKANPLNGLPRLDAHASNGYQMCTFPENSPLSTWIQAGGGMTLMNSVLEYVMTTEHARISETDNHFFTAMHGKSGVARVGVFFRDSSKEADSRGRQAGLQNCMFLMPNEDASRLEEEIRTNPLAYGYFLNKAAPGLLRPEGSPLPGITGDRSKTVTIINYSRFRPVLQARAVGPNRASPVSSGLFDQIWPDAAESIPYPR